MNCLCDIFENETLWLIILAVIVLSCCCNN